MKRRLFTLGLLAAGLPLRAQTNPSANSTLNTLDLRLLGRWVHQSMISSGGGAGGFASFTTERSLEFGSDGLVRQWVRSVGGGSTWSSNSNRRLEFAGRWEVRGNEIWVQPDGQPNALRAGTYHLSGSYLVTVGRDGRKVWER